ncbi:MAG: hypothetical protein ABI680_13620 [Chthoniobacteraceae bacterium]
MIRRLRIVFVIAVLAIIVATIWEIMSNREESRRRESETQSALRKTAEFLKPDTTSDLRFGKPKSAPSPTTP